MKLIANKVQTTFVTISLKNALLAIVLPLTLAACGAGPSPSAGSHLANGGGSNNSSNNRSSAADAAAVVSLFEADGMVIGLGSYYNSRGFSRNGALSIATYAASPRDCNVAGCFSYYSVSQAFANASGEQRTIKAIAGIRDGGGDQLMDSYNGGGLVPDIFYPIGNDQSTVMNPTGLASYIYFAGQQASADIGFTRTGSHDGVDQFFYAKNLTCSVTSDSATCHIIFAKDNLSYDFNAAQSRAVTGYLRDGYVTPTVTGSTSTYVADFVDCGEFAHGTYPSAERCWIISK